MKREILCYSARMNKKNIKKSLLHVWLASSNLFYNTVEACPSPIFGTLALLPIFIFWALLMYKQQPSHITALFLQDPIVSTLGGWFNLAQNPTSLSVSFLFIGLHTCNVGIFLYLARPYLSKLMTLWACWYVGIHPSHLSWFGRLEHLPHILECSLLLITVSIARAICHSTTSLAYRFGVLGIIGCCWAPVNMWLGLASITLSAAYFWPVETKQCSALFFSYATAQLCAILTSPSIGIINVLTNLRRALISLFGLNWIPGSHQWLRYGFLLFWAVSLVGLFLHTTKRRQAGLLIVAVTASLFPQIFILIHPAFVYTALPAFIAALGILYENTGEADMRSVIKSLIIPIYASFLFNVAAILLHTL